MRAKRFTPDTQAKVAEFDCGDEPYAQAMSEWITGDGVEASIARGNTVWLFYTDDGDLIGFGSLGTTGWRLPTQKDPLKTVSIIPALAVRTNFQGQRPEPESPTYARMILDFLISKAVEQTASKQIAPILVLYVDKQNAPAARLYHNVGFATLLDSYKGNWKMILDLTDLVTNPGGTP